MSLTQASPETARDTLAGLIPVSIITGFLGSGKTTLLNRLLKRPEMNRVAVVVNELGEIGVDNDLIEVSSEQMMQKVSDAAIRPHVVCRLCEGVRLGVGGCHA